MISIVSRSFRNAFSASTVLIIAAAMPRAAAAATYVSGNINVNTTWTAAASPYVVQTGLGVNAILTVEPGVVIKVNPVPTTLTINPTGSLIAIGTPEARITFTSIQDDSIAGDTGGDGATVGAPGQWYSLYIRGSATLHYVDVRYGGWGSANEAYGGISVATPGSANLDYCRLYFNQRSGITVGAGSTATIAHSELTANAIGASAYNAPLTISGNSSLSSNSHTGLFLNVTDTYTGAPPSIMNSAVANNGQYGVRLILNSTIPAAVAPLGHENNIFNNGGGADQRQLFSLHVAPQSSWTNNYWGGNVNSVACPWAPPNATGVHLMFGQFTTYCSNPDAGPVTYTTYLTSGPPGCTTMKCGSDSVANYPYAVNPIDNSSK